MTSRIRNAYDIRVEEGVLTPDPAQESVITALERLEVDLGKRGLFGRVPEVREHFYAISNERKIKHPAVEAILSAVHKGALSDG